MHEIIRPAYQVNRVNGDNPGLYTVPEERHTFHTAAGLLHWALEAQLFARTGNSTPRRLSDLYVHRRLRGQAPHIPLDSFNRWKVTPELMAAMVRAHDRYMALLHYLREVEPEWRPDTVRGDAKGHMYFGDNSVELHEVNKYGQRRHSYVTAPHGDACF
jgi:hypothetical protein